MLMDAVLEIGRVAGHGKPGDKTLSFLSLYPLDSQYLSQGPTSDFIGP